LQQPQSQHEIENKKKTIYKEEKPNEKSISHGFDSSENPQEKWGENENRRVCVNIDWLIGG